jgi:DNA polymerase III sliding clamp (beta) subunit (PCNA family)
MEFSIELNELKDVFRKLSSVLKNSTDIEGQVLIDASANGTVVFLGNSGNIYITIAVKADVKEDGVTCVSFMRLFSFIKSFRQFNGSSGVESVSIKKLKRKLTVRAKNYISGDFFNSRIDLNFFPETRIYCPPGFTKPTFSISSEVLSAAISKTMYTVNTMATRDFLKGMFIRFSDDITFVGTDALKLSTFTVPNTGTLKDCGFIVPFTFVSVVKKILHKDGQAFFEISDETIKVLVGNTTIHCTLISDIYPDFDEAFKSTTDSIVVDKGFFLDLLCPLLGTLNSEDNNRVSFSISNKKMAFTSAVSESKLNTDVDYDGDFVIDLNGVFLYKTVESINDDVILVKFSDDRNVIVIDSNNKKNQQSLITHINRKS